MFKHLLFVLAFTGLSFSLNAQERNCGSHEYHLNQLEEFPELNQKMKDLEKFTEEYAQNPSRLNGSVITIPVVVHVVYKTSQQNISDAQIQSQLDVLNDDFRRNNSDATNQWSQATDTEIEFCLATVDPNGNATSGIQRRSTNKPSFSANDFVKFNNKGGLDAWPASDYLNIWVCNLGSGLLGYAQFPGGPANTDGVVNDYAYFGTIGTATAPFDLGRTATHEVGHWLNLRHIWGDGGCTVDDFVADTPQSDAANYGCATGHTSCGSVDMVQNYMDYSDDACMNLFTAGQSVRMDALFASNGARVSLLSSGGCGAAAEPTCNDGIQNGNETDVDCGGPDCDPCAATCSDGVQNGNETDVDCGGPECDPCSAGATCADGVQNGNETGVDCGGPDCDPCNSGGSCDTPGGLFASNIKPKSAKLNWTSVSGATSYIIQLDEAGQTNWNIFTTNNTNLNVSGLTKNQAYDWNVQAVCGSDNSTVSGNCNFVAGKSNTGDCAARLSLTNEEINLYPNPATDLIYIKGLQLDEFKAIQIMNVNGQRQTKLNSDIIQNGIDITNLNQGVYYLKVILQDNKVVTKKFIVLK